MPWLQMQGQIAFLVFPRGYMGDCRGYMGVSSKWSRSFIDLEPNLLLQLLHISVSFGFVKQNKTHTSYLKYFFFFFSDMVGMWANRLAHEDLRFACSRCQQLSKRSLSHLC